MKKLSEAQATLSFIRQHFSVKIISCAIRFVKKRLNMKAVPLVRFILLLFGASPSLAHNKFYRFYSYMVLIIMTANLYAYVIFCNPFSKIYWNSRSCYYFQFLAFSVKWRNASLFCQALAMSMGAFSAVAKSSTLIFLHKTFKSVLDEIQGILNKSNISLKIQKYT